VSYAWIVSGCRTPIGKLLGGLASIPAPQLASLAIGEALRRAGITPERVDEVILGQVLQAGVGQAPARQAALGAHLPATVPAVTINKVCGSGLKAVMLADQAIRAGDACVVVAGGMESMSRAPHLLVGARGGMKFGNGELLDSLLHDGLSCSAERVAMGVLAEATAAACGISRNDQDAFALESHRRAIAARENGRSGDEIVAVPLGGGRAAEHDEGPRSDATFAGLQKLRPAFASGVVNGAGSVTAGNASQISDGAAVVIVTDAATAQRIDSPFAARIVASTTSGLAPKDLFLAPVAAVENLLAKARLSRHEIDLYEINEAFAAQCLACQRQLQIPAEKMNVHGGAIALGHPIGASGARVLVTLLHALVARNARRGIATLCLGGGNAVALLVERP
jgi:acetyl-CoA C-acetyltransferase